MDFLLFYSISYIEKLLNYFKLINIDAKKCFENVCFCSNISDSKDNRILFNHVCSINQSFDQPRSIS